MAKFVPLLIILGLVVVVGSGFGYTVWKQGRCPGHWHSTYAVYVNDRAVSFDNPEFTIEGNSDEFSLRNHIHTGSPDTWHWEPKPQRCLEFKDAAELIDLELPDEDTLILSGTHDQIQFAGSTDHQGGTYVANATHKLTIYHKVVGSPWETLTASELNDRQPRDGERILILFGNYSDDRVSQLQAGLRVPKEYTDVHGPSDE